MSGKRVKSSDAVKLIEAISIYSDIGREDIGSISKAAVRILKSETSVSHLLDIMTALRRNSNYSESAGNLVSVTLDIDDTLNKYGRGPYQAVDLIDALKSVSNVEEGATTLGIAARNLLRYMSITSQSSDEIVENINELPRALATGKAREAPWGLRTLTSMQYKRRAPLCSAMEISDALPSYVSAKAVA